MKKSDLSLLVDTSAFLPTEASKDSLRRWLYWLSVGVMMFVVLGVGMHHYSAASVEWAAAKGEVDRHDLHPSSDLEYLDMINRRRAVVKMGPVALAGLRIFTNFMAQLAAIWAAGSLTVTIFGAVALFALCFVGFVFLYLAPRDRCSGGSGFSAADVATLLHGGRQQAVKQE